MPLISCARPFTHHYGPRPQFRYGAGAIYDVDQATFDHIHAHAHLRHHLEADVLAGGGLLMQRREPRDFLSDRAAFVDALETVATITPNPWPIFLWPPQRASDFPFSDRVQPAPGLQVLSAPIEEDGRWVLKLVPAPASIPPHTPLHHHTCPGVTPPFLHFPDGAEDDDRYYAADGRMWIFRASSWWPQPMPPPPFRGVLDVRGPDLPPEDPTIAMLQRAQREAAAARMGEWKAVY